MTGYCVAHRAAGKKMSKVSSLLDLPYPRNIELIFEKLYQTRMAGEDSISSLPNVLCKMFVEL